MDLNKFADSQSFIKSSIVAFIATAMDFGTLVLSVENLGLHLTISTALGTLIGAVASFILGRYWAFEAKAKAMIDQIWKFIIANGIIMLANVVFVYGVTEIFSINYKISKIVVAIFVGIFVSYPLFRNYVFKK